MSVQAVPEIEGWDERSGGADPSGAFGYVYFSNGSRIGYALNLPGGEPAVWEPRTNGNGEFRPVTVSQLKAAARYLSEKLGIEVRYP